jgi:hypothetical protein
MSQITFCDVENLSEQSTSTLMTWHGQQMRMLHRIKGDKLMEELVRKDMDLLTKEIDKRLAKLDIESLGT